VLKLFHISDLHFCEEHLALALRGFSQGIGHRFARVTQADLVDIQVASPDVLDALGKEIMSQDPDAVVVSGDITTFGDDESFSRFADWSRPLASRTGNRQDRPWLVVSGNHDALRSHLTSLYNNPFTELPWWLRSLARRYVRNLLSPLERHLNNEGKKGDHLDAFRRVVDAETHLMGTTAQIPIAGCVGVQIRLIPFFTTCVDPLWMNLGETHRQDWERIREDARKPGGDAFNIKVVIAHHNPIAPLSGDQGRFTHAYNGMPEGTRFLAELQDAGVDLLLHGHQHEYSLSRFDFELGKAGHTFVLGADSSSSEKHGGFNLIEFKDPNHAIVSRLTYNIQRGFHAPSDPMPLLFERNRPVDTETLSARYELKQYLYPSGDDVDERVFGQVQAAANGMVYMSGRHFRSVRENKFEHLAKVLSTPAGRVRMLLVDPELVLKLAAVSGGSSDGRTGRADLWGRREELEGLAKEAELTLGAVKDYIQRLPEEKAKRMNVRVAHTLLPFGAFARDPDKPWGCMAIKLLPVGAIGDIHAAVLRLNRRVERAMYEYYLRHLKYLFLKSRTVDGNWSSDDDLRQGLADDLLADIDEQTQPHNSEPP
jgi:3',5'-cyclic AMP phosphodiesterase CpdA